MYKYNCRKCPIRNRCIDESANAPTVKKIVQHAFAARTDTIDTWGLLQPNCLLVKAEEERAQAVPRESMLSRRMRLAREAKEQAQNPEPPSVRDSNSQKPDYLQPVAQFPARPEPLPPQTRPGVIGVSDAREEMPLRERLKRPTPEPVSPRWLTVVASGRHITLPNDKALVLGRFDPNFGIPPDVDLSFEDQGAPTVSRQHARITGVAGHHTIEDLGSRYGVFVNGQKLRPGPAQQLQLGDRIDLGNVQLFYDVVPGHVLDPPLGANIRHFLIVTPTGRRLTVTPPNEVIVGRSDRYVDFAPDVDLGPEGDMAVRVSRRHALVSWRNRRPYVEDLGSGFGTRLNGEPLLIGQPIRLKPGDHIWCGGCVLAYDIEI